MDERVGEPLCLCLHTAHLELILTTFRISEAKSQGLPLHTLYHVAVQSLCKEDPYMSYLTRSPVDEHALMPIWKSKKPSVLTGSAMRIWWSKN